MKKLKLNLQQFEGAEVLTRSQLKNVLGGDNESGSDNCPTTCTSACTSGAHCRCCKGNTSNNYCVDAGTTCVN